MEPNDLPIVCIPLELPDQAAADLLEFLQNLTETLERHYFGQLHRLDQARRARNPDLESPFNRPQSNPPF
jgi:hypothetical protein